MLKHLNISNYALIDTLDIDLHRGFSVITGETGAGKSIILGAIGLLMGQRADGKALRDASKKCVIEAHFDISRYELHTWFDEEELEYDEEDCIIRRELSPQGKSRGFINDTPVTLTQMREMGEKLIDVHSQHQNLLLNKQDFQLSVVDIIVGNTKLLTDYQQSFSDLQQLQRQLSDLEESIARHRDNADFLQFQFNELSLANLSPGEQEELEQQQDTMSHSEEIKSALYEADNALQAEGSGILGQLKAAANALHNIESVLPAASEMSQRMDSCYIELKDISHDVSSLLEGIDFDPAELDAVNNRLDRIYELQKKYHCDSVDELISRQEELKEQLSNIENSDEVLAELQAKCRKQQAKCQQLADTLSVHRIKAAKQIEKQMQERLVPLGMPNVRFAVQIEQTVLNRYGHDKVSFLFSANTSTPLQPVSQVASGGEIARVMLALKVMISGAVKLPTIIFDEIDTGVSGKIAESMAQMMEEMGMGGRQVISITHLPQIAAMADSHFCIKKEVEGLSTITGVDKLDENRSELEIARLISGDIITGEALSNAVSLKESATRFKQAL